MKPSLPQPVRQQQANSWVTSLLRRERGLGCLCGGPYLRHTPASPAHLCTRCSCCQTGHPKPARHWLSASNLAVLLDGGFPEDAEERKNTENRKEGEDRCVRAAWGQLRVCLWNLLLGRETSVRWCVRIKHQTLLQKSQEGSGTARSMVCQLADDRCKKLTWLLIPTPLPSQPHPFSKPPQRIKL